MSSKEEDRGGRSFQTPVTIGLKLSAFNRSTRVRIVRCPKLLTVTRTSSFALAVAAGLMSTPPPPLIGAAFSQRRLLAKTIKAPAAAVRRVDQLKENRVCIAFISLSRISILAVLAQTMVADGSKCPLCALHLKELPYHVTLFSPFVTRVRYSLATRRWLRDACSSAVRALMSVRAGGK